MVASRFKVVAFAIVASLIPHATSAQNAQEHVIVRPAPRTGPQWLGLTLEAKRDADGGGVEVLGVMRRSPADGTGVRAGDHIVAIAGRDVDTLDAVRDIVRLQPTGSTVAVKVKRGSATKTFDFALAPMPNDYEIVRNHLLGFEAPEFAFEFVGDGTTMPLEKLRGKPTIIDFWATWCGPCRAVQDELGDVKASYGERINIVGVSDEPAKRVRAYLEEHPARYAMVVDKGESRRSYAVNSIPMVVLLDAEHRVAAVVIGAENRAEIRRKLESLLKP